MSWEALELSKGHVKSQGADKGKAPYRGYNAVKSSSGWTPNYGSTGKFAGKDTITAGQSTSSTAAVTTVAKVPYKSRFPNTDGRAPPGLCKCGGIHWMKDCPILAVAKRVYHGAVEQATKDDGATGSAETEDDENEDDGYYPFAEDEEMESFHGSASVAVAKAPTSVTIVDGLSVIQQPSALATETMAKFVNIKPKTKIFHVNVAVSPHTCLKCPFVAPSHSAVPQKTEVAHHLERAS